MAGIIREAKDIYKRLEKRKKEISKHLQICKDQGIDPDLTVDDYISNDLNNEINRFKEECKIALKLREAAIEIGIIKNNISTPLALQDSEILVGRYCLITIRPPNGTCFTTFKSNVEKFIKRAYFKSGEYAFEQCGETEDTIGNGFHVHILAHVKCWVQFKDLNRDVHTDIQGDFIFQVGSEKRKFLKTKTDLEYCKNYIRGDKHNEDKVAAVNLNNEWRAMNGLEELYFFNNESSTNVVVEEI